MSHLRHAGAGIALFVFFVFFAVTSCGQSDLTTSDEPCSPGTRLCEGRTLVLCSAATGTFLVEEECSEGMRCVQGECRPEYTGGQSPLDAGGRMDSVAPPPVDAGHPDDVVEHPDTADTQDAGHPVTDAVSPKDAAIPPTDVPTSDVPDIASAIDVPPQVDVPSTPDAAYDSVDPPVPDIVEIPDIPALVELPDHDVGTVDDTVDIGTPPPPCGNGNIDPGETCDPAIVSGQGACPTSCSEPPGCATLVIEGQAEDCTAWCAPKLQTDPKDDDGCCPPGALPENDNDCFAECGDGDIGPGEECDGKDLGGATCGVGSIALPTCLPDCTLSTLTCPGTHMLIYEKVKNLIVAGDMVKVRWHPSGTFALLLAYGGEVVRYEAESGELSVLTTLDGVTDLDVDPSGAFFLLVGTPKDGLGRIYRADVDEANVLEFSEEAQLSGGKPVSIMRTDWEETWVIGAQVSNYVNRLYFWKDGKVTFKAFNSSAGILDVMFGHSAKFSDEPMVVTSNGSNGTGCNAFLLSSGNEVSLSWPGSFGNPGAAGWRPGGSYGFLTAWTTGALYVYDDNWFKQSLPNTPSGSGPNGIAWKSDGSRALIVGNALGTPTRAVVIDHRPAGNAAFSAQTFVDASIYGYDQPPLYGSSYADLRDADWRPGPCDEGLIVGSDPGSSPWSPEFATVIRFYDQDDPDCEP